MVENRSSWKENILGLNFALVKRSVVLINNFTGGLL